MVTDLLLERGDSLLCESFTYFYLVDSVLPIKGYNAIAMDLDSQGICPMKLRQVISILNLPGPATYNFYLFTVHNSSSTRKQPDAPCLQVLQNKALTGKVPKVLYTVPTGHNPTGQPLPAMPTTSMCGPSKGLTYHAVGDATCCRDRNTFEQEAGDIQHLPGVQHHYH